MSIPASRRTLSAVFVWVALAACFLSPAAAEEFKAVSIPNGSEGTLVIGIRDGQGSLVIRQGSYSVASALAPKKRWQRLVDAWHQAQEAAENGRPLLVSVKMASDKRVTIEVGKQVLLTFVEETSSHSFTIYEQDYEILKAALERVLQHLED